MITIQDLFFISSYIIMAGCGRSALTLTMYFRPQFKHRHIISNIDSDECRIARREQKTEPKWLRNTSLHQKPLCFDNKMCQTVEHMIRLIT